MEIAHLLRAAHYLHVPPWELAERPVVWMTWANALLDAEAQAEAERTAKMFSKKN